MAYDVNRSDHTGSGISFYIDDKTTVICDYVLFSVVWQVVNIFGVVTNIINIVCFVKQGFKDSTNISLLGLSVSDLASLITMVWTCVFYTPAFVEADLPFESRDVHYLVFLMPHFAFSRVSSCITALLALERCLSIVAPLKVKSIITPERAGISVVCIFIIFTFSATPFYIVNWLGPRFSVLKNKTIIGLISSEDKEQVEMYTFSINNFFIPFSAFVIVAVCTAILTTQLRKGSEWRRTTINDVQAEKLSSRNKKVAKMVVCVSTLFIACFVPISIIMLAVAFEPGLSINGKYFNASKIMGGSIFILESVNSSVNIFIYHHMSTKYRDTFRTLFTKRNTSIIKEK